MDGGGSDGGGFNWFRNSERDRLVVNSMKTSTPLLNRIRDGLLEVRNALIGGTKAEKKEPQEESNFSNNNNSNDNSNEQDNSNRLQDDYCSKLLRGKSNEPQVEESNESNSYSNKNKTKSNSKHKPNADNNQDPLGLGDGNEVIDVGKIDNNQDPLGLGDGNEVIDVGKI